MTDPRPLVAVTGVSGLLGGALARRLVSDGYRVRALIRKATPAWTDRPGLEPIEADLSDKAALARLVDGVDAVFHIAAMFRSEGPWEEFLETNLHGTENLLTAAAGAGVRRFIYCSTIGVHGSVATSPGDENTPFDPRDFYQRSKLMAEQACRAAVGKGMEIVILRPCSIYGPGDLRMLKLFRMLQKRLFVQIGRGEANFHPVYIDDLVDGFMRGMTTDGIDGETFIIGGPEYIPLKDYLAVAAATIAAPAPRIKLPYKPVETAARLCESIFVPLGLQPPLHRRRLSFFKHNRAFSIERARTRLGYAPHVALKEGFRRTVQWYREERLLS